MGRLLKSLFLAAYHNTIGAVVRLAKNAYHGRVDKQDHATLARLITYTAFIVLAYYFPASIAMIALLRMLVTVDVIGLLASILQDTANAFA